MPTLSVEDLERTFLISALGVSGVGKSLQDLRLAFYTNPPSQGGGGAVTSVAGKTGVVSLVKSDVGLPNVDNTSDAAKPVSTATAAALAALTKASVGLGNVDNTSDANKPVSTATATALGLKANAANPSFTGTVTGVTAVHVGLGNVDNTSDANKPVSTAQAAALALKAPLASPTFTGTVGGITAGMIGGLSAVATTGDAASLTGGPLADSAAPTTMVKSFIYNGSTWPSTPSAGVSIFSGGNTSNPPVGNAPGDIWITG